VLRMLALLQLSYAMLPKKHKFCNQAVIFSGDSDFLVCPCFRKGRF
jgi:hypothetical protein